MKTDKGQLARVTDVIFLGPYMIWFGIIAKNVSILNSSLMIAMGVGTIIYNLKNFILTLRPNPRFAIHDFYFGLFAIILWLIIYFTRN